MAMRDLGALRSRTAIFLHDNLLSCCVPWCGNATARTSIIAIGNQLRHPKGAFPVWVSKYEHDPLFWASGVELSVQQAPNLPEFAPPAASSSSAGVSSTRGCEICVGLFLFGAFRRGLRGANLYMSVLVFWGLSCRYVRIRTGLEPAEVSKCGATLASVAAPPHGARQGFGGPNCPRHPAGGSGMGCDRAL